MFEGINLLFISEKQEVIHELVKSINIDKKHIFIASNVEEAVELFDAHSPKILFLYYSMVEHSQALYLKMHDNSRLISQVNHQIILLIDHSDFEIAYEKCIQDIFYDYIIIPPRLDKLRINLTIKRALKLSKQGEELNKIRQLSSLSHTINKCRDEINNSIDDANAMSADCGNSFNELSNDIKTNIKNNSAITLKDTSASMDTMLIDMVDKPLNSSRDKVQSIVESHARTLTSNNNKFKDSLSELDKLSASLPKKVLLIEDNQIYGEMVNSMLEQTKNYDVKLVSSIHQGLVAFVCDRPDIVLLDFELEDGDANLFLGKVSELPDARSVPVVMLTSHTTNDVYTTTSMLGAKGFIRKPASKEIIINMITKLLAENS